MERRGKSSLGCYAEKSGVLQSGFLFQVPRMWPPGMGMGPTGDTGLWDHQKSSLGLSGNKVMISIPVIGAMPNPNLCQNTETRRPKSHNFSWNLFALSGADESCSQLFLGHFMASSFGGLDDVGLNVEVDDLRGLSQPLWFCVSIIIRLKKRHMRVVIFGLQAVSSSLASSLNSLLDGDINTSD